MIAAARLLGPIAVQERPVHWPPVVEPELVLLDDGLAQLVEVRRRECAGRRV